MKTILTILAAFAAVGAFALSSEDKAALADAEKSLTNAAAPYAQAQFYPLAVREILTGTEPGSFAALLERIDKAAAQVTFKSDADRTAQYRSAVVTSALWRFNGKFIPDGYKYAKENGVANAYFVIHAQKLGMSEDEELAGYIELFSRASKGDLWIFKTKSPRFFELLKKQPADRRKQVLNDLNWRYSEKLADDEKSFMPVVKKIRTMLDLCN